MGAFADGGVEDSTRGREDGALLFVNDVDGGREDVTSSPWCKYDVIKKVHE